MANWVITATISFRFWKLLPNFKTFEQRRQITQLRLSAHRLRIEIGRYQGSLYSWHDRARLCLRCNSNTILMMKNIFCYHEYDRLILLQVIKHPCKKFDVLNSKEEIFDLRMLKILRLFVKQDNKQEAPRSLNRSPDSIFAFRGQ